MAEKKVTEMILKADLQCVCCIKKIRKLLSRYPEIRDWVFDENSDSDTVTITVTCGDPERLRYKLCRNGRGVVKSIEIKKPQEPAPAAEPPKQEEVTPPPADPAPAPKEPEPEPKAPEETQKDPEPGPGAVEPVSRQILPVQCVCSGTMPIFCTNCYCGRMLGPWSSRAGGGPFVYFEGTFNGKIGLAFGPNHCTRHGS